MTIVIAFIWGTAISLIANIWVGAVNLAIVQRTINKNRKAAYLLGFGSMVMEMFYAGIPVFGATFMQGDSIISHIIFWISIPLLLFLGIRTILLRTKLVIDAVRKTDSVQNQSDFMYGLALCASNPMVLIFWSGAVGTFKTYFPELTTPDLIAFWLGVPAGLMILYSMFIAIAHQSKKNISLRARVRLNLVVGVLFIILAVYLGVHYLFKLGIVQF